jgi:dihydrofolate synthase/folylpolyglutamate synthase
VVPNPIATVITPIAFDHMEFLGETLPKIAAEKAGIMKPGVPCILAKQSREAVDAGVLDVFRKTAGKINCPLYIGGEDFECKKISEKEMAFHLPTSENSRITKYPIPNLLGAHQIDNAGTALATIGHIDLSPLGENAIKSGLRHIHWPGRLERITSGPLAALLPAPWELWFDGAHNVAGAQTLAAQLQAWEKDDSKPVYLLLAMREGKDISGVQALLSKHLQEIHVVSLEDDFRPVIQNIIKNNPAKDSRIVIAGSFYTYNRLSAGSYA